MLSLEQRVALVALLLRRLSLGREARADLELCLTEEEVRRILTTASGIRYFVLPYPIGRIGVLPSRLLEAPHH